MEYDNWPWEGTMLKERMGRGNPWVYNILTKKTVRFVIVFFCFCFFCESQLYLQRVHRHQSPMLLVSLGSTLAAIATGIRMMFLLDRITKEANSSTETDTKSMNSIDNKTV